MTYKQLQVKYKDSNNLALPGKSSLWRDRKWAVSCMDRNMNHCSWVGFYRYGNHHGQQRFVNEALEIYKTRKKC